MVIIGHRIWSCLSEEIENGQLSRSNLTRTYKRFYNPPGLNISAELGTIIGLLLLEGSTHAGKKR